MKSRHLRDETKSIELKNGGCGKSEQGINLFVDLMLHHDRNHSYKAECKFYRP